MDEYIRKYGQQVLVQGSEFIYRIQHRVMEGDCQYDHGPRLVKHNSYYIDRYPVTNHMYKIFIDETGYYPIDSSNYLKHWITGSYPAGSENHPVVWVSQSDATVYAKWRGGRLPSDSEWQYAACGSQKNLWPWGNTFDKNLCNCEGDASTPVDQYPGGSSSFGCEDMSGNVWEWLGDIVDDGQHLFTFVRGGSYYRANHFWHAEGGPHPTNYHLKFPLLNEALNRCETVGFRCVKEYGCND